MRTLNRLLFVFLVTTSQLLSQNFAEKKILLDNLGEPGSQTGIVRIEHQVYCGSLEMGKIHLLTHIDGDLSLFEYSDNTPTLVSEPGNHPGFMVDMYDHNGDGEIDILGHFGIHYNSGNLNFNDRESPINGSYEGRIYKAIDFDKDGHMDILTRDVVFSGGVFRETVYIYLLDDNQGIISTLSFPENDELLGCKVADLNNDGFNDVVYAVDIFGDNRLKIQINNGNNTFTEQDVEVFNTDIPIAVGDFDNDNDLDILITGFNGTDVELLTNIDGIFSEDEKFADTDDVYNMQVADFDRDGNLDIVILENLDFDSLNINIALGNGDNTFSDFKTIGNVKYEGVNIGQYDGAFEGWMDIKDFDNDGDQDILVNAILEQQYVIFENLSISTSVNDIGLNNEIEIFPNPVQDILTVETTMVFTGIEIFNLKGELVKSSMNSKTLSINVSDLDAGYYMLKVYDRSNRSQIKRFIKI